MTEQTKSLGEPLWSRCLSGPAAETMLSAATPSVFYFQEQIEENLRYYEETCDDKKIDVEFRYAVKACGLSPVLQCIARAGWGVDCQSQMEASLALRSGVAGSKISICSPRLSEDDARWAMANNVHIIADSPSQLGMLAQLLNSLGSPNELWHLGVRISLPVEGTKRFHTKLGMELDTAVAAITEMPILARYLNEVHHHGAAREVSSPLLAQAAMALAQALARLESACNHRIRYLNLGGGLEPNSVLQEHDTSTRRVLGEIMDALPADLLSAERSLVLEPGRAIVKDAAVAMTKITNVKALREHNLAVVDISTNLLIPLPLAQFSAHLAELVPKDERRILYDVVDGTCSPAGVICRQVSMPPLKEGQRLLIGNTGAYTWSLAEPFYDWLPDLYWVASDGAVLQIINRRQAREIVGRIWGYGEMD